MKGSERISVLAKRAHCGVKRNCLARGGHRGDKKEVFGDGPEAAN
jgi:hypothetical protein